MTPTLRQWPSATPRLPRRTALLIVVGSMLIGLIPMGGAQAAPSVQSAQAPGSAGNSATRRTQDTQGETTESAVQINSISPWVDSEGEFQIRFTVAASVPADAELTYTIHQPLHPTSTRPLHEVLDNVIDGGSPGKVLQAPVTAPLSEFGSSSGESLLSIPVRSRSSSDRTRAFLPLAGIHPVSIIITSANGPELWSTVVFLNHLPRDLGTDDNSMNPIATSMVVPVQTSPALVSGKPRFNVKDVSQLNAATNLLSSVPTAPLKVLLRGDVIAGLNMMDTNWANDTLDKFKKAFNDSPGSAVPDSTTTTTQPTDTTVPGDTTVPENSTDPGGSGDEGPAKDSTGPVLVAAPFVASDTESIVKAQGGNVLREQLDLGIATAKKLSTRPLLTASWLMDDHLGPSSASEVEALGFTSAVVSSTQVTPEDRRPGHVTRLAPMRVAGTKSLRVAVYDDTLSAHLTNGAVPPATRAHDVLTSLVADWLDNRSSGDRVSDPTAVLVIQPTVSPMTVAALSAAILGNGPIRTATTEDLLSPTPAANVDSTEHTVALRSPASRSGMGQLISDFNQTGQLISSFSSAAADEPLLETWRIRNAETLDASLNASDAKAIHNKIRSQIAKKGSQVVPPPSRRVLLASRDTTIPLRFKNELPYEIKLTLYARSPRIGTPDDESIPITLRPGDNRIDLPVVVRAPGESLLRLRLTTPDGAMAIAAFDIPVQSTAISGVGAVLSVVSILFLLLWWVGTFRRNRRANARAETTHPSTVMDQH